ncbi:hypothetical protein V6N11_009872 [Hibiscus sabdariffa]|uniref:Secreted protein n=1 Tax=Hibiscus sabdariffa TaxID=183260 RepID=A0ABR1ZXT5_9ROSI
MLMSYELLALLVSLDTVRMLLQEPKSRVKMNVPPRTLPENWIFRHMYKYHMPTLPGVGHRGAYGKTLACPFLSLFYPGWLNFYAC